jgi:hypothetical protein
VQISWETTLEVGLKLGPCEDDTKILLFQHRKHLGKLFTFLMTLLVSEII